MSLLKRIFRSPQTTAVEAPAVARQAASRVSIDLQSLMKIRNLELRAKRVVDGFLNGIHRSPWHGFSVEFTDYRQYTPGDDVRYLDWKLFARQDRYYIKRFEDETNLRCYLVADLSASMEFGSLGFSKADYARTALATLGYYLSLQRDAVGLLTFDETIGEYLPPRYRPGHLRRVMLGLERATAGKRTDLAPPLQQISRLAQRRGWVVLASDLLAPIDDLQQQLGYLRSQGHEVLVWRILDPAEVNFEFSDAKMFEDMESGKRLFVDPVSVRKNYLDKFQQHSQQLSELCNQQGVDLQVMQTDRPLDEALLDYVKNRSRMQTPGHRRSNLSPPASGGRA